MKSSAIVVAVLCGCASSPRPKPPEADIPIEDPALPIDDTKNAEPREDFVFTNAPVPAPTPVPIAVSPYIPKPPFTAPERVLRFPRGDVGGAKKKNQEGLDKRRAGDSPGAKAAYQEALALSPRYAPARYNLACELALEATTESRAAALDELETLLRLGTPDARLFVARARFEADFAGVKDDPKFVAVVGAVAFDPSQPFGRQFCDDPGRIGSLIDPEKGFEIFIETETGADNGLVATYHMDEHVGGKAAFDRAVWALSRDWYACLGGPGEFAFDGSLLDFRLARAKGRTQCLTFRGESEWSDQFLSCFVDDGGTWRLASWGMWPDGPIGDDVLFGWKKKAVAARDRGYARFGVTKDTK